MRRIATLSFVALVVTAPLLGQQQRTGRPGPWLIYGPVHTIRDERAAITEQNGEPVEGPRVLVMTWSYNEDRTEQERTTYEPDGSVINRTVDRYEPDGRLIESQVFNGKGVLMSRTVHTYDGRKQLLERVAYGGDGAILNRTVFRSRGDERQSETTRYDAHGAVIGSTTTTNYLREGRADTQSYAITGGTVSLQAEIINNPDGSQEYRTARANGTLQREVIIPHGEGSMERVRYRPDGTVLSRERFAREFDSCGNITKTVRSVAEGDSSDFKPVEVTYRTLTYYGKE